MSPKVALPNKRAKENGGTQAASGAASQGAQPERSRYDQMIELVDHCTAAKALAETLGDKFLVYLISVAILEAQRTMSSRP